MKRDAYDGEAVPFSLKRQQYKQGTRDVAIFIDKGVGERRLDLKDFNKWIVSDRPETKINIGKDYDFYYTKKIRIPVNKQNISLLDTTSILNDMIIPVDPEFYLTPLEKNKCKCVWYLAQQLIIEK